MFVVDEDPFFINTVGKSLRVNWCLNTLLRELTGYDITTTRIRLLVECSIQDGLEDGIVSLPDRLAATRQIGHTVSTFKLSYNPRHRRRDAQQASQAFTNVMTYRRRNNLAQDCHAPERLVHDGAWRGSEGGRGSWSISRNGDSDDGVHQMTTSRMSRNGDSDDGAHQMTTSRQHIHSAVVERRNAGIIVSVVC